MKQHQEVKVKLCKHSRAENYLIPSAKSWIMQSFGYKEVGDRKKKVGKRKKRKMFH